MCLVAMNPAALKANLAEMPPGSTLLVNSDAFDERNLGKGGRRPRAVPAAFFRSEPLPGVAAAPRMPVTLVVSAPAG